MGNFVLIVTDGDRIRSFHSEVFDHVDRVVVERIVERRVKHVRRLLESSMPNGDAASAAEEVSARANGNGAALPSQSFRAASSEGNGTIPGDATSLMVQAEVARTSGFSGNVCAECGSFEMVRSGTCETCRSCGKTSGGCS